MDLPERQIVSSVLNDFSYTWWLFLQGSPALHIPRCCPEVAVTWSREASAHKRHFKAKEEKVRIPVGEFSSILSGNVLNGLKHALGRRSGG